MGNIGKPLLWHIVEFCGNYQGWAKTMTWKGLNPMVKMIEKTYQKGVKVCKKDFKNISDRLNRHESLPKYYVTIHP
jgi:hypothetical protein